MGGDDIDADTAERWGLLTRTFPSADSLDRFIDGLARRVGSFPPELIDYAKAFVSYQEPEPIEGLREEDASFRIAAA